MKLKNIFSMILLSAIIVLPSTTTYANELYPGDGYEVEVTEPDGDLYGGDGSEVIVDESKPNKPETPNTDNSQNKPNKPDNDKNKDKESKEREPKDNKEIKKDEKKKIETKVNPYNIYTIEELKAAYSKLKLKTSYYGFKVRVFKTHTDARDQYGIFYKL